MEHILQATICCIPDLDTCWMSSDKSVEDRVVQDTQTGIFVSQMMVDGLIIIVEDQASTSDNDSLWRLSDGQSINFVQATVKSLGR